jgi:hypothetical protein
MPVIPNDKGSAVQMQCTYDRHVIVNAVEMQYMHAFYTSISMWR